MDDSRWPMTTTPLDWMRCSVFPWDGDDGAACDGAAACASTLPPPAVPNASAAALMLPPSLFPTVATVMVFTFNQEVATPGRLRTWQEKGVGQPPSRRQCAGLSPQDGCASRHAGPGPRPAPPRGSPARALRA